VMSSISGDRVDYSMRGGVPFPDLHARWAHPVASWAQKAARSAPLGFDEPGPDALAIASASDTLPQASRTHTLPWYQQQSFSFLR
jgi:hypothetical protein